MLGGVDRGLNPERAWIAEGRDSQNIMRIEKIGRGEVAEITLPGKRRERLEPGLPMILQLEADHKTVARGLP